MVSTGGSVVRWISSRKNSLETRKQSPNYQTYVATLLAAKLAGAQVTVYTTKDAGTGYCRIGYVRVS